MFYANTGTITQKEVWELQYGGKVSSERVFVEFGGGASNAAVSAARLGLRAGIISSIGDDEYGQSIRAHLKKEGVDTRFLQYSSRHTGFSFILVHQKTGEHIAFIHYGASEDCALPVDVANIATEWFYVSSLNTPRWKRVMQALTRTSARIAWNPGNAQLHAEPTILQSILKRVEVLLLNEDEARALRLHLNLGGKNYHHDVRALHALGPRIVVITRGRKGSVAYDGQIEHVSRPVIEKPVDTTGAGDSYGSAFIAGLHMYGGDIDRSLELAALNSQANVTVIGAQKGLLYYADLPRHLQERR